jgi:CRP/FNR family transcriptional regulator, cyclic AMP receptor protein
MLTREKMRVCNEMMTPLPPIRSANEDDPRQDYTQEGAVSMDGAIKKPFNTATFLATKGPGRSISTHAPKQVFFSQGGPADAVFFLQTGRAKLTVRSKAGKEATVTLLAAGDFFGEEAMAEAGTLRTVTASAITACTVLRIATAAILRVLQTEHKFSIFFLKFIVIRGMRTQADLIDQLFNSSERRLARTLLLMAEYGEPGAPETLIPPVSQETLADMIGTTRSRVSFFMNRFRKLSYIKYNGGIRVHKSLLKVFLQDQLPEENSSRPKLLDPPPSRARTAKRAKLV